MTESSQPSCPGADMALSLWSHTTTCDSTQGDFPFKTELQPQKPQLYLPDTKQAPVET